MMSVICLNQNSESIVRISPFPGMGFGMMTSKAEIRSVATMSRYLPQVVEVADLAAVDELQAFEICLVEGRLGHGLGSLFSGRRDCCAFRS